MKKDVRAVVNGVPLDEVLGQEKSAEIQAHLQQEQSKLRRDLGLRRSPTPRRFHTGCYGRSGRVYSVRLMCDLRHFLLDDSLPVAGIADLFGISLGELHAYRRHLGIWRRRGRRPR